VEGADQGWRRKRALMRSWGGQVKERGGARPRAGRDERIRKPPAKAGRRGYRMPLLIKSNP